MKMKIKNLAMAFVIYAGFIFSAQASLITIRTDEMGIGNAPFTSDQFYTLNFTGNSSLTISSILLDLQASGNNLNGFFDLVGVGGVTPFGPVVGLIGGLDESDVMFTPSSGTTPTLLLTFASGLFGVGDFISFGADIDLLDNGAEIDGDGFGLTGVGFTVTLSDGQVLSTTFEDVDFDGVGGVNDGISLASVQVEEVPAPSVLALLGLGLMGMAVRRKRLHK